MGGHPKKQYSATKLHWLDVIPPNETAQGFMNLLGLTLGICDSPTSGLLWLKLHNFAELHPHDVRISWIETSIFWIDTRIFWVEARWISTPSYLVNLPNCLIPFLSVQPPCQVDLLGFECRSLPNSNWAAMGMLMMVGGC